MSVRAKSKLTKLRQEAGLTQAQLAVFVGVTKNTIQNWEKADGLKQLEKYIKLGEIFGLKNLKDLFEYTENSDDKILQSKDFSLDDIRKIRESWGTSVTETSSNKENNHLEQRREKRKDK